MIPVQVGVRDARFTEMITTLAKQGKLFVGKGAYTLLMSLKNRSGE